ncbi:OPT/YSL family transporter [Pandoraea pneumonica]|uniref:OPT/YSL family transporter n=1 Tax=Pandoraea pneumonica TaxID=2508299 RepID=UPI003CEC506B
MKSAPPSAAAKPPGAPSGAPYAPLDGKHPTVFEPTSLLLMVAVSVAGAIIGMQLIVTLGISANTSIIGALLAMLVARLPIAMMRKFRSVHRQNLVQTAISSATFGASNSLMIPIGIPFAMGRPDLIVPLLIGVMIAMFLDGTVLYRVFDSKAFPATGTWPAGIATAESIIAGDQGGKKARLLVYGVAGGVVGSVLGIPMSAFGVAFIGNIWALGSFGAGLLIKGYSLPLLHVDLNKIYLPHGFMIGAGVVALIQVTFLVLRGNRKGAQAENGYQPTVSDRKLVGFLGVSFLAYVGIALLIALCAGLATHMSPGMLIGFLLFAAFAAFAHELIVGIAAMYSGWFPAFAVALITLVIGMLCGFPPTALGLLVGLSSATGPAFADMGYDLKTGFILRGNGADPALERAGRKQQYYAGMLGFCVAAVAVVLAYPHFFANNMFPPVDKVYAATIEAGVSSDIGHQLMIWAIPGALLQLIGGPKRQLGVLMATGLLLMSPAAGWAVAAGLVLRVLIVRRWGAAGESACGTLAAGFIAGDALYSFFKPLLFGKLLAK